MNKENDIYPAVSLDMREGDILCPINIKINLISLFSSEDMTDKERIRLIEDLLSCIKDVNGLKKLKKSIDEWIKTLTA